MFPIQTINSIFVTIFVSSWPILALEMLDLALVGHRGICSHIIQIFVDIDQLAASVGILCRIRLQICIWDLGAFLKVDFLGEIECVGLVVGVSIDLFSDVHLIVSF